MRGSVDWAGIAAHIQRHADVTLDTGQIRAVGGGSINEAWRAATSAGPCFIKVNRAELEAMFVAEAEGLEALGAAGAVRVPRVIACGVVRAHAYLALEYLELGGRTGGAGLGEQLAAQHRKLASRYGWHRDNTIGSTPQPNAWEDDWIVFLREHRLGFQLELAGRNGYGGRLQQRGERLLQVVESFFGSGQPPPSLLHGDLWGGNWGVTADGEPVIFDPAVYYGDREADIAMTRLFGGFGADFYAAYENAWPSPAGADVRTELYNLYHVLNHLNLFGAGYGRQAERMIDTLLAETGL